MNRANSSSSFFSSVRKDSRREGGQEKGVGGGEKKKYIHSISLSGVSYRKPSSLPSDIAMISNV